MFRNEAHQEMSEATKDKIKCIKSIQITSKMRKVNHHFFQILCPQKKLFLLGGEEKSVWMKSLCKWEQRIRRGPTLVINGHHTRWRHKKEHQSSFSKLGFIQSRLIFLNEIWFILQYGLMTAVSTFYFKKRRHEKVTVTTSSEMFMDALCVEFFVTNGTSILYSLRSFPSQIFPFGLCSWGHMWGMWGRRECSLCHI